MRISINAGHHMPEDCGACGCKCKEADLVYKYANRVVDKLKADGHDVNFICNNELQGICDESNHFNSDFFVSIHLNSCGNPNSAYGTETFYYKDSVNGKKLAKCIQESVLQMMEKYRIEQRKEQEPSTVAWIADRGLKNNSLYVTGPHMDAVAALVEIGFINNELEEDILRSYPDEIADSIYKGIVKYMEEINA